MASDLVCYLESRAVVVAPRPEGKLYYRAKAGVMTLVLQGVIKTCRQPLWHLLTTGEDTELPKKVTFPATDFSRFRTWVTGKVPANGQLMTAKLAEPQYHDTPSEARTFLGRPCPKKVCKPTAAFRDGRPASVYFRPSGLCVACWERWEKTMTEECLQ